MTCYDDMNFCFNNNYLCHHKNHIGIIAVKVYPLYCHPGKNLTLFKHVRYYQESRDNDINMAPYLYLSE